MESKTIIGPPGTGKTQFIEEHIKLRDLADYLYLTYNVNMAFSARKRIEDDRHKIGTIHSIMAQQNGLGPFLKFTDQVEFAKRYGLTYPRSGVNSKGDTDLERFLQFYDRTINLMENPKQPLNEKLNMPYLYDQYERWKESQKKYDYTDILSVSSTNAYRTGTLYLDEAQDLSPLMWKIIDNIQCDNRIIVGDPHQSINGFRGVRVQEFKTHISNVTVLNKSYRFGDNVRELANRILGSAKIMDADYTGIGLSKIDGHTVQSFSTLHGTKAILCRSNSLAYHLANKLPYAIVPISKEHSYGNGWTDQAFRIAAIMRKFPNIDASEFAYIVERSPSNLWVRGTKSRVKKGLTLFSYDLMPKRMGADDIIRKMNIQDSVKRNALRLLTHDVPVIQVDTIHSAKGLEWDHVMVMLDFPQLLPVDSEERRLYYVATTRGRSTLDFWYSGYYKGMFSIPGHAKVLTTPMV